MAVSKSVEKTRLLVRVENTDGSLKNLTFNNIRESASDEELLHAGKAIAGTVGITVTLITGFMRGRRSPDCR